MINFIIRKILLLIPMLVAISFLIFLGVDLMPGDAVDFMIPPDALATIAPEKLEAFKNRWIPLEEEYFSYYSIPAKADEIL